MSALQIPAYYVTSERKTTSWTTVRPAHWVHSKIKQDRHLASHVQQDAIKTKEDKVNALSVLRGTAVPADLPNPCLVEEARINPPRKWECA